MPKQKVLSGKQLIRIFQQFGFEFYSQNGSHIKLRHINDDGELQTLIVPNHSIDRGLLHKIYKQACKYIPEKELMQYFYTS